MNDSSRDSSISITKMTLSSDNENYSTIGASSTEPSFEVEEDDKYSVVDNGLIKSILSHNNGCTKQELEEDEKYSTVDDDLKHSLGVDDFHHKLPPLPPPPPPIEDETEPSANYDEIKSIRNDVTTCTSVAADAGDFPDYAVVDLSLKREQRAKRAAEQKQEKESKVEIQGMRLVKLLVLF